MELRFSDDFLKALEFSRDEAIRTGWHNIAPDHIMLGILRLENDLIYEILGSVGVQAAEFKASLDDAVFVDEAIAWDERDSVVFSDSARSFLQHACLEARRCGAFTVDPVHFILAVCRVAGPYSHDFLDSRGISLRDLVEASGLDWDDYGLDPGIIRHSQPEEPSPGGIPDPILLAEQIEKRLREGYTTGIIPVS